MADADFLADLSYLRYHRFMVKAATKKIATIETEYGSFRSVF